MNSYTDRMWNESYEQIVWLYREGASIAEIQARMDLSEHVIMAILEKYLEKQ